MDAETKNFKRETKKKTKTADSHFLRLPVILNKHRTRIQSIQQSIINRMCVDAQKQEAVELLHEKDCREPHRNWEAKEKYNAVMLKA